MKLGKKVRSAFNKIKFFKFKFSFDANYEEYKKVVIATNKIRCQQILEREEGVMLPHNLGKIIILKNTPRVKQVYSMTKPGTKIYNLHSFGMVYRVYHKERDIMRYPFLYKFRPHRQNLKMPLYDNIMNRTKDYLKHSDFV